jgi:flagellum-specific ATP synthase
MLFEELKTVLASANTVRCMGKVDKVVGLGIESTGPNVNIGDVCHVTAREGREIAAEVVGFREDKVLLMPFEDLSGIGPGSIVESTGDVLKIPSGTS